MSVQDDERERELVRMFNLTWDPSHQRAGVDAVLEMTLGGKKVQIEIEVKSTTGSTVSTARDVGIDHIQKWRKKLFVIGFYSKEARRPELQRCLCLTPQDMEPWILSIENKILIDFKLAACAARRLTLDDLFDVCGEKESYSIDDAKLLYKMQWSAEEYIAASDIKIKGKKKISPLKMLDILSLRSRYIAERGATLNNPHITKKHLDQFTGTDREILSSSWASSIRDIAAEFVKKNPDHPAIRIL